MGLLKFRYLVLFDYSYCDKICEKSGITDNINHNFKRIRIDLYDSLSIEQILSFHKVIKPIKSVANRNKDEYYYNIFLEKRFV